MINTLGLSKVTNKPLCLRHINANSLRKIVHWTKYHLEHQVPDNHTIERLVPESFNNEKQYRQFLIQKTNIEEQIEKLVNQIKEMENPKSPLQSTRDQSWMFKLFTTKTKKSELQNRLRHQTLTTKHEMLRAASEKRRKIKSWEGKFLETNMGLLFNIINAANFLEIPDLLDSSCKKAADTIKIGSLTLLDGLPDEIQVQIAQNLPPHAFINAARDEIIPVSAPAQTAHAKVWASILRDDTWFDAAVAAGANPVLIGKDLDRFQEGTED